MKCGSTQVMTPMALIRPRMRPTVLPKIPASFMEEPSSSLALVVVIAAVVIVGLCSSDTDWHGDIRVCIGGEVELMCSFKFRRYGKGDGRIAGFNENWLAQSWVNWSGNGFITQGHGVFRGRIARSVAQTSKFQGDVFAGLELTRWG